MNNLIIHPDTHSKLVEITDSKLFFEDGNTLLIHDGTPILFGKNSVFNAQDIINAKITTQNSEHLDTSNIKNYIRRKILPSLTCDFNIEKRYNEISKILPLKLGKVLIIGAGEKVQYYKELFKFCEVVTSDVHNEFKPDYIFDGHNIPFQDNTFDLVLAAQVIEHVINPWQFCSELQRVVKIGGLLQIEAPQNFPYHAEPYDFFRFTFTGLRSLFPNCEVLKYEITEGNASMVAVTISNYLINTSSKSFIRSTWLFITYILLGWMKYLDKLNYNVNRRSVSSPKGFAFTFKKDIIIRQQNELFNEFYQLKK